MSRPRYVRLSDPIFKATHVLLVCPPDAVKATLRRILTRAEWKQLGELPNFTTCAGICFGASVQNDDHTPILSIVWVDSGTFHDRLSTFVHEIGHAVDNVMHCRGVEHNASYAEPWRYYQEFLFAARKALRLG